MRLISMAAPPCSGAVTAAGRHRASRCWPARRPAECMRSTNRLRSNLQPVHSRRNARPGGRNEDVGRWLILRYTVRHAGFSSLGSSDMMADLMLAVLHFILIFALVAILGAEAGLVHEGMDARQANRVAVLDRSYGAAAGLLLVVGF